MPKRRFTNDEIAEIAEQLGVGVQQKHDVPSTALQPVGLHGNLQNTLPGVGPYGPFAFPGPDPRVHSTLVLQGPGRTLAQTLSSRITRDDNLVEQPMRETLTGITDPACTNASSFCGTPPSVGLVKSCRQTREYGMLSVKTHMQDEWQIGHIRNNAEQARQILNMGPVANPFIPSEFFNPIVDTRSALAQEWLAVGARIARHFDQVLINGNQNTSYTQTECGWIREFEGLGRQIKTGYEDELSHVACPSMDSIVVDFGGHDIEENVGGGDPRGLIELMGDVFYSVEQNATQFGELNPGFVWVMRRSMFRELTKLWACNYTTARCNTDANAMATARGITINMDGTAQNQFRSELERGQYLMFDGGPVPVLFSDGITQLGIAPNMYKTDLLLLPLNYIDMEYYPCDNQYAREWNNGTITSMNNGMYRVLRQETGACSEFWFQSKLRAHLLTPQLSARIDNAVCASRTYVRDANPDDSGYVNGGTTSITNWV